ncbi:GldG family protein [Zavarzinia sp. CC-PAN008]|uniref:GldG family protein n=1 Tax=Zavarzinia sp. CC-PAN008 TaxID=3243332 RepID=UPI003F743CFE
MLSRRSSTGIIVIALAAVLFVALNLLANVTLTGARADLTQDQMFTLSDGTHQVLSKLDEPVSLRLFYSERLGNDFPQVKVFATRVRDLLREYVAASNGMIRLEVIDPDPFSETEDDAVAAGIQATQTPNGDPFYFGLVAAGATDRHEVIPIFAPDREAFLEYDLTRVIQNLSGPARKIVGLLTSLPMETGPGGAMAAMRGQSQPYAIYEQLAQVYEVRMFASDMVQIGDHINLLIIAHPGDLADQAIYAIDQYVLAGGRVLVLVDPYSEASTGSPMGGQIPNSSNLPKLFKAWGVNYDVTKILGDRKQALNVNMPGSGRRQAVPYVLWAGLGEQGMDRTDVTTADLHQVTIGSGGFFTPAEGATTTFTPLIQSSDDAMAIETAEAQRRTDPDTLLRNFLPTGERYTVAARITGPARTAFPDGPPALPTPPVTGASQPVAPRPTTPAEAPAASAPPAAAPPPATSAPPAAAAPDGAPAAAEDKPEGPKEPNQAPAPATIPGGPEPEPELAPPGAGSPERPQLKESAGPINVIVVADSDMLQDRFWVQIAGDGGQRMAIPVADNGAFIVNAVDNLLGSSELITLRSRGRTERPFERVADLRRGAEQQFLARQQVLQRTLEEKQTEIQALRRENPGGGSIVSPEQEQKIREASEAVLATRKELRDVQHNLQKDIDSLERIVKVVNIGAMPVLVALLALGVAATRRRRAAGA